MTFLGLWFIGVVANMVAYNIMREIYLKEGKDDKVEWNYRVTNKLQSQILVFMISCVFWFVMLPIFSMGIFNFCLRKFGLKNEND